MFTMRRMVGAAGASLIAVATLTTGISTSSAQIARTSSLRSAQHANCGSRGVAHLVGRPQSQTIFVKTLKKTLSFEFGARAIQSSASSI